MAKGASASDSTAVFVNMVVMFGVGTARQLRAGLCTYMLNTYPSLSCAPTISYCILCLLEFAAQAFRLRSD